MSILENKHILVTGASSGIGRATAVTAAGLGGRMSIIARREQELGQTLSQLQGSGHHMFTDDLAQLDGIEALVKSVVEKGGPIDGFAHCAGHGQNRPLPMTKPAFMQDIMTVNCFSFVELMRALAKKKRMNDLASVVSVSSVASIRGDKAQGAYAASKAAINGLVPPLAKELAPRGIRINAVAFGMVETEMYKVFHAAGGDDSDSLKNQYLGIAQPQDAANVLCFLLSPVSRMITGTVLTADGGYLS